jgi:cytochrome c556
MNKTSKFLIAAALLGAGTVAALAGAADDTVNARQACMKAQGGGFFGVMAPMVKGEKPYDRAAIDAAFTSIGAACANWDSFWAGKVMQGETVKSYAKPEIWTDTEGFAAAGGASYQATTALKATTDEAGFKAAFGGVGAGCKGCHDKFRLPKE